MSNLTDRLGGARASIAIKAPCRVATTANITLSGFQTINGVTLADGDANLRVLVKNQTATADNGIYIASSGIWQRARDFDANGDVANGTRVIVGGGSQAGFYTLTCSEPVEIGTTALSFALASEVSAYYPVTTLETAASVTPSDYTYPPGDVRRYGADPTGVASSHTAFADAWKTGHLVLGGGAYTYLLSTNPGALTTSVVFDGQGCTLKTSGNVYCFYRNPPAATATVTISSGATEGSRTITCASTTGLVVGQICHIDTVADDHPPSFNTIVAINTGTGVVTLERQLRHTYTGTLTLLAWNSSLFLDRFEVRNTTFDGALSTSAVIGEAMRVGGYRRAVVENCTFKDWSGSTNSDTRPVVFIDSLDVSFTRNRSEGQDNQTVGVPNVLFYECGTVDCSGNSHEGHAFGYEPVRCDHARVANNSLIGLLRREFDDGEAAQSVRGIKAVQCGLVTVSGNAIEGYESGLKIDNNFSATITGNTVRAALGRTYSGQIALNCAFDSRTQAALTISGNVVEGCDGVGIGVSYAGSGIIEPSITGNVIRNAQASGIFLGNVRPTITGNTISDWGLRNSSDPAIYHGDAGGVIVGNSFRHATLSTLPCIRDLFGTGYNWEIDGNVSHSGNTCIGKGSVRTLASAGSMFLGAYPEQSFVISGTTTIDSFGGAMPGRRVLRFTGTLTLAYGAATIVTPSAADLRVSAGDVVVINNETGSGGLWRVLEHHRTAAFGTLALVNGANSDIALPGNRTIRITGPTGAFSVSGFAGGTDGDRRTLINATSQNMTIANDATSTAANRILTQTGADVTQTAQSAVEIIYSSADSRWLVIGTQA